jgi:cytochrome c biogenesis protein CcmG/thiol:disulfide interchange protein DsbE
MEKNNEMHVDRWVESRLAVLNPDSEWQPNAVHALTRLREQHGIGSRRGRKWVWAIAAATAVCLCLMALPGPRVLAEYCLSCSVELWQNLSTSTPIRADVKSEKGRKLAPNFTLNEASGKPITLSDLRGNVVLLNFWATWCGGCKVEIPWFIEFENTYKDSGLVIIGVSMDDDGWNSVKPYVEEKKMNYPVVMGNESLRKLYRVSSMPMTLLIDRSGKIAASHVGLVSKSDYKVEIETLLNGKVATGVTDSIR